MWQALPSTDTVQDFIDYSLAWLDDHHYGLTIDIDMANWGAVLAETSPGAFVNPAFDPRHSRLTPANSFWLDVKAGSKTIATCAARLFVTEDVLELLRTMRLWYAAPPASYGQLAIDASPNMPLIRGNVGHEGGLWVHPQHRKRGLSVILPHLARAICAREWQVDWQTGIARQGIGECGIVQRAYGMPHSERCFEGYFPPTRSQERFYLVYMDNVELTAGLDLYTVAGLLPNRHQQPGHAPALVVKG